MTKTTTDIRVQIPEKFKTREDKAAMVERLSARLSRSVEGSDDFQSLSNKLAKARATPVARKPKATA